MNIDSKTKDEKQKDINELKNLKDMHEKEINMIMNIYMIIYAIMKK